MRYGLLSGAAIGLSIAGGAHAQTTPTQETASNPLVVGGDIHAFVASEIRDRETPVAPCLVGGSITTFAGNKLLRANTAENSAYLFANNDVRGYGRIDLTPDHATATFRAIRDPNDPRTSAYDLARFTVETGSPALLT